MLALDIVKEPGRCRSVIRLPSAEAEYSFTRGSAWRRILSVLTLGWIALLLCWPLWMTGGRLPRLPKLTEAHAALLSVVVLVTVLAFLSLFTLCSWWMASTMLLGFFRRHEEVEVVADEVIVRCRRGPWRWTRRLRGVATVRIRPPAYITLSWPKKDLASKECRLFAETDQGRYKLLLLDRPHGAVKDVAGAIVEAISRRSARTCRLIDHVDPCARDADAEAPPRGADYRIERRGENVAILPAEAPMGVGALLSSGTFRAGVWLAVLPYPMLVGMAKLWPDLLEPLRARALTMLLVHSYLGLLIAANAWYGLMVRHRYLITAEHLVRQTDARIWRRTKAWKRSDIVAVRVGMALGDQRRPYDVLELVLASGEAVKLERGTFDRLRYLATSLRRELGVGAEPARTAVSAQDGRSAASSTS